MEPISASGLSNIRYLTASRSNAALVVSAGERSCSPNGRYTEQPDRGPRSGRGVTPTPGAPFARRIRALRARRVGFESRHLSVDSFGRSPGSNGSFRPRPGPRRDAPDAEGAGEILAMERATAIATASLLSAIASGVRGKAERDVAADLAREMVRRGARGSPFPDRRGRHAPRCPTRPRPGAIAGDGPLVLDFGARWNGYCSDETVTILPRRPRSPLGRRSMPSVGAGGRDFSVRPGEPCGVDARVRDSLDRSGYLKYFVHSTGHGVGLDVHERPSISPRRASGSRRGWWSRWSRRLSPGSGNPPGGHGEGHRIGCERITFLPKTNTPLV